MKNECYEYIGCTRDAGKPFEGVDKRIDAPSGLAIHFPASL